MKKVILLTAILFCCFQASYTQQLDLSFGNKGIVHTGLGITYSSIAIQSDGKIVAGGSVIARYKLDGSPDSTFNGVGVVPGLFFCSSLAIQNDGKIVVTGDTL